jgi:hypothetical protein
VAFLWPWVGLLWLGRRKPDVGQTAGSITGRAGGGGVVTLQLGLGCWGTRRSSSPVAGIGGLTPAAVHLRGGAPRWWSRRSGRGRTRFWSSKRIVIRGRKDVRRPWKPRLPIRPLGRPALSSGHGQWAWLCRAGRFLVAMEAVGKNQRFFAHAAQSWFVRRRFSGGPVVIQRVRMPPGDRSFKGHWPICGPVQPGLRVGSARVRAGGAQGPGPRPTGPILGHALVFR